MPRLVAVRVRFLPSFLPALYGCLLLLGPGACSPAQALAFNIGEVEAQFDSSLSVATSWGLRDADSRLVGASNGGAGKASTADAGRLNYSKGQVFSKVFKGVHDLQLTYGDSGLFVRGRYWYDFEQKDENTDFTPISDHGREEGARASGGQWLDAFVYHNYTVANLPGTVRAGRQVVNWGESTFIGNGINSINPVQDSALHRPGTELKDGLLPVSMLFASQALTDRLSVEAFYQLQWENSVADNCGTFFGSDLIAKGCNAGYSMNGQVVPRGRDRDARDGGQWGTALRWLGDDTDYGLYYLNYHSRTPMLSTRALANNADYFLEYPEDIHLFGASFSTTLVEGTAWRGEVSYRPNAPVQLNTNDLIQAVLGADADVSNRGYRRMPTTQLQTSLTHYFEEVLGAQRLTMVGEAGWVHVNGIDGADRYGRDGVFGSASGQGFVTRNAWGYRAKAILDYPSALLGVNLKPNVSWSHDVQGYGPNGLFNEGAKALSVGLAGDYQNTYTASVDLTEFWGGRYNVFTDRDYLSMNVGVNF